MELDIPVEDAEKVIADYEAEHAKPAESAPAFPAALEELFGQIRWVDRECCMKYEATLPKDEDGLPVWPKDTGDKEKMTLEDYLGLKYPEAEEEELCRDYSGQVYGTLNEHPELARLQTAFEIDYACATCISPEECQLPEGCRKGQPKPEAKMFTGKDGKRFLGTKFEGCIKCRHDYQEQAEKLREEKRREAEFALMIRRSDYWHSR